MAPRKEILDSDEEDDDFSPVKNLIAPPRLDESIDFRNDSIETPKTRRAESTDPSFFRKVYDGQHVVANAQQHASSVAALSSEPVSTLSPNPPLNLSHVNGVHDPSHLSSITDPVPASRRRHKISEMKEVVDLTQVTTPGRPTPNIPTDIWDFPASPDGDAPTASTKKKITIKLKKAGTKRESASSSSFQSPEKTSPRPGQVSPGLLPGLSVAKTEQSSDVRPAEPRRKRRRISSSGQQAPNSQEVDLLVIPRSEEKQALNNNHVSPTGNSSSIVGDSLEVRSTSLLVVPTTTLTVSQKDEYKFVSLSSEADGGHEHLGLPDAIGQTEDLHKSSGSATIKYPTPVEYASSEWKGPHPGDYGTASSSRPKRRRNVVNSDPPSSPDIISAPAVTPREKGVSDERNPDRGEPYLAPSSTPPRSTRRIRRGAAVLDELPSPTSAVAERERPRSSGRTKTPSRKHKGPDETAPNSSAAAEIDTGTKPPFADDSAEPGYLEIEEVPAVIQEEPPQKKTRGRKRKEVPSETVVEGGSRDTAPTHTEDEPVPTEAYVAEGQGAPAPAPAPKKRRGRPRKEPQSEAIVVEEDVENAVPAPDAALALLPDDEDEVPNQKRRRGRPRKSDVARPVDIEVTSNRGFHEVQQDEEGHHDAGDGRHITEGKTVKKAITKATSAEGEKVAALSERDSNSSLSTTPALTATDTVDETVKENPLSEIKFKKDMAKEEGKAGPPCSQLGKVQYRVGLSKKSRIAPLLKSFRK